MAETTTENAQVIELSPEELALSLQLSPKVTHKKEKIKLTDILLPYAKNTRNNGDPEADLDIQSMRDAIAMFGGITTPPFINGDTMETIRGFRRLTGALAWYNDPACPKKLKDALEKIECEVWRGLSDDDEMKLRVDDGETSVLPRSAVYRTFFRVRETFDKLQAYRMLYQSLARATGSTDKAAKAAHLRGRERDDFLKTWFKGTGDQFLELVRCWGPVAMDCLVYTELAKERNPGTNEGSINKDDSGKTNVRWFFFDQPGHCRLDRSRVKEISERLTKDAKSLADRERIVKEMMDHFWKIDKGQVTVEPPTKRRTDKEIIEDIGTFNSDIMKQALLSVTADKGAGKARASLRSFDEALTKRDSILARYAEIKNKVKKSTTLAFSDLDLVICAIQTPSPANLKKVDAFFDSLVK